MGNYHQTGLSPVQRKTMRTIVPILGLAAMAQAGMIDTMKGVSNIRKNGFRQELLQENKKYKIAGRSEDDEHHDDYEDFEWSEEDNPIPWVSSPDFVDQNGTVKYFGITEHHMPGIDCDGGDIFNKCDGEFYPAMDCAMYNAEPWCPETIEEAKQVFANLAINFMNNFRLSDTGENPQTVENSAHELYFDMMGSVWTGIEASDALSDDISKMTCRAVNYTWTPDAELTGFFTPNKEAIANVCVGMGSDYKMVLGHFDCDATKIIKEHEKFEEKEREGKVGPADLLNLVMRLGEYNKYLKRAICVTTEDKSNQVFYQEMDPAAVKLMEKTLVKMKQVPNQIMNAVRLAMLAASIIFSCCCCCCCCCCCKPCRGGSSSSSAEAAKSLTTVTQQVVTAPASAPVSAPAAPPMMPPAPPMAPAMPAYGQPAYGQQPQQPMGGINLNISNNNTNTNR